MKHEKIRRLKVWKILLVFFFIWASSLGLFLMAVRKDPHWSFRLLTYSIGSGFTYGTDLLIHERELQSRMETSLLHLIASNVALDDQKLKLLRPVLSGVLNASWTMLISSRDLNGAKETLSKEIAPFLSLILGQTIESSQDRFTQLLSGHFSLGDCALKDERAACEFILFSQDGRPIAKSVLFWRRETILWQLVGLGPIQLESTSNAN